MPTLRKILANRRNALRSTGPRTSRGKAVSRSNSLLHGFRSRDVLLPGESPRDFRQLLEAFRAEHNPHGPLQEFLVEQMAVAYWKLARLTRIESWVYEEKSKDDNLFRDLREAINPSDVPSQPSRPPLSPQARIARAFLRDTTGFNTFSRLSHYEMRLERSFYRALLQLQRLQSAEPPVIHPSSFV